MYFVGRSARVCASLAALGSFLSAKPTMTSLALGSFFKRRATSSPTRLQALSKRDAPALLYPQSPALAACGGGGGCCTSTLVEASAGAPRPSLTEHFTGELPGARAVGSNFGLGPSPGTFPGGGEERYVRGSPSGVPARGGK